MPTKMNAARSKWFKCNYVMCFLITTLISVDILLRLYSNLLHNACDQIPAEAVKSLVTVNVGKSSISNTIPKAVDCDVGTPCEYPEEVDLRIIVMTFNRDTALMKILESLDRLVLDSGDTVALEIWIDRDKKGNVDEKTVRAAEAFVWLKGIKRVHVQKKHAGIYGQWIDTWKPKADSRELALLLEDDLLVSPFTWRWLKAVHKTYQNHSDCFGYTLQSEGVNNAVGGSPFKRPTEDMIFMYQLVGSWGFAPNPAIWKQFQDWFHMIRKDSSFRPYVDKLIMTGWYKKFEKSGKEDSMWTMWFIYYCNQHKLYGVYNNINHAISSKNHSLCVHRAEPGLHFSGQPRTGAEKLLLSEWSDEYIHFPKDVKKHSFSGVQV